MTTNRRTANIYSAEGRANYVEIFENLKSQFLMDISVFIARLNRKGAGLEMAVGDVSYGCGIVAFRLARAPDIMIKGELRRGTLKILDENWEGRSDFARLIPRLGHELAVKVLANDIRPSHEPSPRMKR